ncbi:MAG TPA: PIN domain-containing protein [Candidatus Sulfotelmatobacter sp.]|jgi:predicted nucleic acid-binding protein|nr:PIN domain-containing protein [Candidatus Sulfotelmatobacter sp.]
MMRAVLADTGPLYAAVDPDDEHHARALLELQKLNRDRHEIVILYSTLLEAYSLIMFRLGRDVASNWLLDMAQTAPLNPTSEDYWQAAARIRALTDQSITLFDAVAAVVATRLKLDVWTYDHHFDVMRVGVWR